MHFDFYQNFLNVFDIEYVICHEALERSVHTIVVAASRFLPLFSLCVSFPDEILLKCFVALGVCVVVADVSALLSTWRAVVALSKSALLWICGSGLRLSFRISEKRAQFVLEICRGDAQIGTTFVGTKVVDDLDAGNIDIPHDDDVGTVSLCVVVKSKNWRSRRFVSRIFHEG